jgi:hypothetical protein
VTGVSVNVLVWGPQLETPITSTMRRRASFVNNAGLLQTDKILAELRRSREAERVIGLYLILFPPERIPGIMGIVMAIARGSHVASFDKDGEYAIECPVFSKPRYSVTYKLSTVVYTGFRLFHLIIRQL